ncbi:MAG TPA: 5'-methylthioadenosine phosphorylase, partial [Actinomycetota bacterium]|nr:5'-methylthioadenosine phosphorylase [Actinomycetota bacterium]
MTTAEIGVFGGSGFYAFLNDPEEIVVDTPYGKPAAAVTVGSIAERRVAFIPRHGKDHEFPPHRVPYRANVWAMKELGVTRLFGPSAAGSLR